MLDQSPSASVVHEAPRQEPQPKASPAGFTRERVLAIRHYTDTLFSFTTTRTPSFRFQSGQFTMIGLEVEGRPLLRAYSMASAVYDDHLEFFSIKVPNGPLTSRLQHIKAGDEIIVGTKPTGTLLIGNLRPGKRLWLLGTGTGFAPFSSILKDPDTYERFETVIVVEGCRYVGELEYATRTVRAIREHELLGELAADKLLYYAAVTREPFWRQGRITDLVSSGRIARDLGLPTLARDDDRVMLCGNPEMLADTRKLLIARGYEEGSSGKPGDFVIEKAFVER